MLPFPSDITTDTPTDVATDVVRTGDDGVFSDDTEPGTGGVGGPAIGTESDPASVTTAPSAAAGAPAGDLTGVGGNAAPPGTGAAGADAGTDGPGTAGMGPGGAAPAGTGSPGNAAEGSADPGATLGGPTVSSTGGTTNGSDASGSSSGTSAEDATIDPYTGTSDGTTQSEDDDSGDGDDDCPRKQLGEKADRTTETLEEAVEDDERCRRFPGPTPIGPG